MKKVIGIHPGKMFLTTKIELDELKNTIRGYLFLLRDIQTQQ